MSDASAIEWTETTWNPTTGCDRVSPGCDHCYALTLAKRLKGMGSAKYQNDGDPRTSGPGFGLTVHPDTLNTPLTWRKPRRVFVNSMSDLFHKDIPDEFIAKVFVTMARTPQHTYQILTKRHGRLRSLLNRPSFRDNLAHLAPWPLPNVWLGVSVEDQQRADLRIPALVETPAAVRFLSCEPLLGPIDLDRSLAAREASRALPDMPPARYWIDWVIVGGESGKGARPMHLEWGRSLRDQCTKAEVPFFFKQWGNWCPPHPDQGQSIYGHVTNQDACQVVSMSGRLRGRPWPGWAVQDTTRDAVVMRRYGKKESGRILDGRTWDEFPGGAS